MSLVAAQAQCASRRVVFIALTVFLAAAYTIGGKLSLLFAIPPGYASAIFPPAGIAVAAVFITGRRSYPGLFLGALLLCLWVGLEQQAGLAGVRMDVALGVALASTLQAALGGLALRRWLGYPVRFDSARELLIFHLLAPCLCLVSATLSVGALVALGVVPAGDFGLSWLRWWVGDVLGVLVVLPVALVFFGKPRALWRRRALTVALPMTIAFGLLVVLYMQVGQWEESDSLMEFRVQSRRLADNLLNRLDEQASLLEQTEGLFVNGGTITDEKFQNFTAKALQRFPMIQAIEWAPRVAAAARPDFVARQRLTRPGFDILDGPDSLHLVPAKRRGVHYPVTFTAPWLGNREALGFDLASRPDRNATIAEASRVDAVRVTAPLRLIFASQNGLLLFKGIKAADGQQGVLLTVLRMTDFMEKLLPDASAVLCVRLVDVPTGRVLYDTFAEPHGRALTRQRLDFGGRGYLLETAPKSTYLQHHGGWQGWVVLAAGALGISLLGALLLLASGHADRVEAQVRERTLALQESEARVREITATLAEGVYVLDEDARVTFVNPEACRLLGWSEDELMGERAHGLFHHMHPDGSPLLPEVCPLLKVLRVGGLYRGEETFWRRDESPLPVEVSAAALSRGGRIVGAVIAFSDISERKRLEATLRREATHDTLTELPNRRLFMRRLQRAIDRAHRAGTAGAVLFLDLDDFKRINDSYGHEVGDRVLRVFAERLGANVRKTDTVARLAGDEFTVLLEGLRDPEAEAEAVARAIIEGLSTPAIVAAHAISLSSSIGIATFEGSHTVTPDKLLSRADAAMYQAKMAGKNGVVCEARLGVAGKSPV